MDSRVWSKLPAELLELSLSFLPLVEICRFRIVCRRWNNVLCSTEFGKRFVVNSARIADERVCLIVSKRVEDRASEESQWSFLNLREKKWHNLKHDLPMCGSISDMDGGLVCTTLLGSSTVAQRLRNPTINPKSLIIFNPFGGAVKVLPDPPSFDGEPKSNYDTTLKLIVDNNSNTFKVLLIMDGGPFHARVPISIYESSADKWTTAPMPPFVQVNERRTLTRVVYQGLLYCCTENCYDYGGKLWSFNILDGSWEDTGVRFPVVDGFSSRDLAVTDNRLLLTKIFRMSSELQMDISEILLADKITKTVVCLAFSAVFPIGWNRTIPTGVRAFGLNKSKLLLHCSGGEVVIHDLAARAWEWFPLNPLGDSCICVIQVIAGRMDYCLPNTPW